MQELAPWDPSTPPSVPKHRAMHSVLVACNRFLAERDAERPLSFRQQQQAEIAAARKKKGGKS